MGDSARPIVLLHGWGGSFVSTFTKNGWMDRLAELNRPIHSIDLPGHGGGGSYNHEDYSDLAGQVLSLVPSGLVDVIGYSLGGKIALAIAAQQPQRFNRVVVGGVGDNIFGPEPSGEAVALALINGVAATTPKQVAALVEYSMRSESDPKALAAVLRRSHNPQFTFEDAQRIERPILVVNGDQDHIATPDGRLLEAINGAERLRLTGVDHIGLPASINFLEAAAEFLNSD